MMPKLRHQVKDFLIFFFDPGAASTQNTPTYRAGPGERFHLPRDCFANPKTSGQPAPAAFVPPFIAQRLLAKA